MALKAPSPKNIHKRLKFFLDHLDLPNARWEVFNLTNLIIVRDFEQRRIDRPEFLKKLKELDETQGLPQPKKELTLENLA